MSIIAFSQRLVVIVVETSREQEIIDQVPGGYKRRVNWNKWNIRMPALLHIPEFDNALREEKCQVKMF